MSSARQRAMIAAAAALAILPAMQAQALELQQLPPKARACTVKDLTGLRKMRGVYERDETEHTRAFNSAPHQYLFIRPNQTFVQVIGSTNYQDAKLLDNAIREQFKNNIRQYVLGENGALYFYKDGKVTDAYACRLMPVQEGAFRVDDILLIITDPATNAMTVKLYSRQKFKTPAAPAAAGKAKVKASDPKLSKANTGYKMPLPKPAAKLKESKADKKAKKRVQKRIEKLQRRNGQLPPLQNNP